MKHWTEWVSEKVTKDKKQREDIEAFLSALFNGLVIGLILWMMVAKSCDVCYEMRLLNMSAQLQNCINQYQIPMQMDNLSFNNGFGNIITGVGK